LPRDFIACIFEAAARLPSQRMQESIVVTGLIVFNFLLLALAAAAGLFDVDVVFALTLLMLAATAALVSIDLQ
jgi:inner membrane protein involved in colicin E2 resistance